MREFMGTDSCQFMINFAAQNTLQLNQISHARHLDDLDGLPNIFMWIYRKELARRMSDHIINWFVLNGKTKIIWIATMVLFILV